MTVRVNPNPFCIVIGGLFSMSGLHPALNIKTVLICNVVFAWPYNITLYEGIGMHEMVAERKPFLKNHICDKLICCPALCKNVMLFLYNSPINKKVIWSNFQFRHMIITLSLFAETKIVQNKTTEESNVASL